MFLEKKIEIILAGEKISGYQMNVLDSMKLFSCLDTALIVGAIRLTNISSHMLLIPAVLRLDLVLSGWVISFLVLGLILAAPVAIWCPCSLLESSCLYVSC